MITYHIYYVHLASVSFEHSVCIYIYITKQRDIYDTIYIYICDGYQQQQPIVITRCFIGFTQSSDYYTILFNL